MTLQPREGRIPGDHYLETTPETALWGFLPNRASAPVLSVDSGATVTIDTLSHEGILEDQGRNPARYFGQYGVTEQHVLKDAAARAAVGAIRNPFVETDTHWIPTGMDPDLNEAMKKAVRAAVTFLETTQGMPRATALAYLSAAGDFEVSQVVDAVKSVHCLIRKADFAA